MATLLIKTEVRDYTSWRPAYDAHEPSRIGATVIKRLEPAEGLGHLAFHNGLEKINDAAAIGKTQHDPPSLGRNWPPPRARFDLEAGSRFV